jgi:carboxylesterase type B
MNSGKPSRAIIQSGTGTGAMTPGQAQRVTDAAGDELGLDPTVGTLAEVPDDRFVEIMPRLGTVDLRIQDTFHPLGGLTPFSLVLDQQPADALAAGQGTDVDLLIGSNTEEGNLYLAPLGGLINTSAADLLATAGGSHRHPAKLVEAYQAQRPSAAKTELQSRHPQRRPVRERHQADGRRPRHHPRRENVPVRVQLAIECPRRPARCRPCHRTALRYQPRPTAGVARPAVLTRHRRTTR